MVGKLGMNPKLERELIRRRVDDLSKKVDVMNRRLKELNAQIYADEDKIAPPRLMMMVDESNQLTRQITETSRSLSEAVSALKEFDEKHKNDLTTTETKMEQDDYEYEA